ncbi:histone H3.v1-like [Scomber scombrus]|uniref:Histone H3.v1-like n=1 Tax=Scomber scombrus TaxID=13677 RepID=A0AAV1QG42_SCOSC
MSCSCCCCVAPGGELLQGTNRKKRLLVREEEEEEEEEEDRRNMDISALTAQYRSSRERQKQHTQVLLFKQVSEDLSDAVNIISVTQGLSSWEPKSSPSPLGSTPDPWHVHLSLHRRSCPTISISLPTSSSETTNSRRGSSSSEESRCRKLSLASEQNPRGEDPPDGLVCGSFSDSPEYSAVSPDGSSSSSSNLTENHSATLQTSSSGAAWSSSRKSSGLGPRFTRQLSLGGVGSSANQNYYPFPNRKAPRISEAAKKLGMYSSF